MPSEAVLIHLSNIDIITIASIFFHSFKDRRKAASLYLTAMILRLCGFLVGTVGKDLWKGSQMTSS